MTTHLSDFKQRNLWWKNLVGGRNFGSGSSREHAAGLFMITVSDVWCLAFLQIYLETTV
jgi:3-isopropylmalate dehydratase small subunit